MDEWSVDNEFEKISNVYFDSKYSENANDRASLNHTFKGWALSPNGDIVYSVGQIISLKDDEIGDLTLYAIWSIEYITLPSLDRTGYKLGAWTCDKEGFTVAGNVNSSYPITSDTTVYAKWNLIQYTINYNGNGYTSGSTFDVSGRLHSAETNYQLASNGYVKTGYRFDGWNTEANGSGIDYNDKESVSYITSEANGSVTLYAQWVKNTYEVVFNKNTPNYGATPTETMESISCVYDEGKQLPKNTFKVDGWIFKGWATSTTGSVVYTDEAELKNLTSTHAERANLYAVWEVEPYTVGKYVSNGVVVADTNGKNSYTVYNYINETPQLKCGGKVIVDWSSCSNGNQNYISAVNSTGTRYGGGNNNLDIAYGVTEVFFVGNPNSTYMDVYIYTVGYPIDSSLTIHMKDMNFSSGSGIINSFYGDSSQDVGMYLTIDCLGTNTITATSSDGTAILNHKNLTITGSGNLSVTGGKGADATTAGGDGSNGGIAIIVDHLTVNMTGTLTVTGGNGGMGSAGISYNPWTGASSSRAGGNGGNGGVGGDAFVGSEVIIYAGKSITFIGGDGGAGLDGGSGEGSNGGGVSIGGVGGSGGNGGAGGSAITANSIFNYSSDNKITFIGGIGGNGGSGGQGGHGLDTNTRDSGGDGGNGGSGGNSGYCVNGTVVTNSTIITLISGVAGDGGNGGNGGNAYRDSVHGNKVYIGNGGNGGNGGNCLISSIKLDADYYSLNSTATSGKGGAGGVSGGGASGVGAIHYGTGGTGGNSGSIVIGDNTTTGKSGSTGTKAVNGAGGTGGSAISVIAI